jgi:uncharacterized repeat protein (TIGR01451 family)
LFDTNAPLSGGLWAKAGWRHTLRILAALLLFLCGAAHAQLFLNVNKTFSPINPNVGATSTLRITLANTSPDTSATAVAGTDTLPAGLAYVSIASTSCSIATSIPSPFIGGGTMTWSSGVIPPSSTCTINAVVTPLIPGTQVNTIPQANVSGVLGPATLSGFSDASATITAGGTFFGLTGSKSRSNSHIHGDGTQSFTITLNNPNAVPISNVAFTDNLPSPLVIAVPGGISSNSCGGTVLNTATLAISDGNSGLRLTGGSIANNASCSVTVVVRSLNSTAFQNGNVTNSINAGSVSTSLGVTNTAALTQAITVQRGVQVTKSFTPNTIVAGGTSTLLIRLSNFNLNSIAGAGLTDTFPAGIQGVSFNGASAGCTVAPTVNVTAASVVVSGATIGGAPNPNANSSTNCDITVTVTGLLPAGGKVNSIPAGTLTGGFTYAAGNATLTVNNPPPSLSGAKAFSPTTVTQAGTALLSLTLRNIALVTATSVDFTDSLTTMGGSITVAASPAPTNGCGGVLVANFGSSSFSLTGGEIPPAPSLGLTGTCVITVPVVVAANAAAGVRTNSIAAGSVTSSLGTNSAVISGSLTVTGNVTVAKAFSPATVPQTGASLLTITLSNSSGGPATAITSFVDNLTTMGAGNTITIAATPAALTNCGGTLSAVAGSRTISMTGGSIPDGGSCQIIVPVEVAARVTAGAKTNTINAGGLVTSEGINSAAATANLTVSNALGVTKGFNPSVIGPGELTRLTVTVTHALGALAFTGMDITDSLPAGHTVSTPANSFNSCGGTLTANPGSTTISLTGGGLPAGATTCSFSVDIVAPTGTGSSINTITAASIQTDQGVTNAAAATATLQRTGGTLATLNKDFTPANIEAGQSSVLRVLIINPNTYPLTAVSLTDAMPAGMIVAPVPSPSTTCGAGVVSGASGSSSFTLTNGTVPARVSLIDGTCSFQIRVTSSVGGNSINTLAAGTMTSAQSVTNNNSPSATLQVLFNLNIDKAFTPTVTQVGQTATLTVFVYNSNTTTVAGLNPSLTDNLPSGLELAGAGSSNTCGGSVTDGAGGALNAGDTSFRLNNGNFGAGSSCAFSVVVRSVSPTATGSFVNSIPSGALATVSGTNPTGASATLSFLSTPIVTKAFTPVSTVPGAITTLTFTLSNPNSATLTPGGLTNAAFTDVLPSGVAVYSPGPASGTCTGAANIFSAGATTLAFSGLTVPAAGSCTVSVPVTATLTGVYVNTVTGLVSTQTPIPSTVVSTATLTVLAPPTVTKAFTPTSAVTGGTGTAVLTITLTNPNATTTTLASPGLVDVFPTSPAQMTYSGGIASTCTGATFQDSGGGALAAGDVGVRVNGGAIPPGGSCSVTMVVYMPLAGIYLNNMPSITTTNAGSSPIGATASTTILPGTQVNITKTNGVSTLPAGATTAYTITIDNLGPGAANGSAVTDPAVVGLSCTSVTCAASSGATCLPATVNDLTNLQGAGLTLGNLPAGGQIVLSVTCQVTATGQ